MTLALMYVLIGLQGLDFVSTYRGINSGKAKEANPVVAWLLQKLGLVPGLLIAKSGGVAVAVGMYLFAPIMLVPFIAIYTYVVYNNFKITK